MLKHGSLFSGIGGFDLAAEWAGWDNIFHCEWNEFGQKVLKHHFPKSISYADITKTDFSIHRGNIDIISGGFPCQPYSSAGKRLGKADERHLFPEMLRCIKEVKPRWIVGENVRGLVSWNDGLVFNEVYDDLEREGYEVQSFLIPAAGVNAPHQRYRIWFVAYSNDKQIKHSDNGGSEQKESDIWGEHEGNVSSALYSNDATNSDNEMRSFKKTDNSEWQNNKQEQNNWNKFWDNSWTISRNEYASNPYKIGLSTKMENRELEGRFGFTKCDERDMWHSFPTQSPICGRDDGFPEELDSITIPKWRNETIKAYGNAIVPQVAFQIFKAINEFERLNK